MIKQYLIRKNKILLGIKNTYLNPKGNIYQPEMFWDNFFKNGINDSKTISPIKGMFLSMYHYTSIEQIILRYLHNNSIITSSVLDIGSGAGHWIKFYQSLGVTTTGIDVSNIAIKYLNDTFEGKFIQGQVPQVFSSCEEAFDIINAIGVMFHIIDDNDWKNTIVEISKRLLPNGIFITSGQFGCINGVNVQIDKNGNINKRLRSKNKWRKTLKEAGFSKVKFYKNKAYLNINDTMPENNILIATKKKRV